jgi:hypothetical protein
MENRNPHPNPLPRGEGVVTFSQTCLESVEVGGEGFENDFIQIY